LLSSRENDADSRGVSCNSRSGMARIFDPQVLQPELQRAAIEARRAGPTTPTAVSA